jgi:hypothetical protein
MHSGNQGILQLDFVYNLAFSFVWIANEGYSYMDFIWRETSTDFGYIYLLGICIMCLECFINLRVSKRIAQNREKGASVQTLCSFVIKNCPAIVCIPRYNGILDSNLLI